MFSRPVRNWSTAAYCPVRPMSAHLAGLRSQVCAADGPARSAGAGSRASGSVWSSRTRSGPAARRPRRSRCAEVDVADAERTGPYDRPRPSVRIAAPSAAAGSSGPTGARAGVPEVGHGWEAAERGRATVLGSGARQGADDVRYRGPGRRLSGPRRAVRGRLPGPATLVAPSGRHPGPCVPDRRTWSRVRRTVTVGQLVVDPRKRERPALPGYHEGTTEEPQHVQPGRHPA